ncbi:type IV pilin N-terminal domain-containing protein [Halorubellus salinus]|uniref:type IV pilin N-terminal domain-containing protein n=1 Tax=Halorubellus salinus TaxID=755309 RepID=UPI001D08D923|nr:type IV pilin N-terminal domain-containing protein [Halorubellus salinus]
MSPPRRRDLLAFAGATATTLAAGCLSTGEGELSTTSTDDEQSTTTNGPADTTTGGGATATIDGEFSAPAWLPGESTLDAEPLFVFAGDLDAPRDAGVDGQVLARMYETTLAVPGDILAGDDVVEFASLQGYATACTFDLPASEVRDRLAHAAAATATAGEGTAVGTAADGDDTETAGDAEPPEPTGDAPDGYEEYVTTDGVCWLGADHLLFGETRALVDAMFDARAGDVDRYASNPDFEAVLDAADDVDLLGGTAHSQQVVSSASAYAYAWRFGDRVDLVAPFAFDDAASIDADAVASLGDWAGFAEYEQTDVTTDGRVVTFTGELPVGEFDLLERDDGGRDPSGGDDATPQVSFAFEYDQGGDGEWDGDAAERVVLTHQGGDNVDLANVAVHYDGTDVATSDAIESTRPNGDTWAAGGQWTLQAATADATFESGATLQVVWTADDGGRSAVIAQAQLV